ncbi:MAG: hypothetical protein A2275_16425 [Bacteroidetes bacterium RIFOXYA12_FULL_35_11]|nr:MAG: hypothetical protein A2X01_01370 [Bacteroidetes bacterium GWF2_35_48]OFY80591.1 MAG: hypothetical protein A2275_16425 [Bacteroidetes bacterium RIFOXYA12_FULL_35_11]OFY92123.1 MAG: hypothetical protein A2309_06825 [Bacteroidetes bacterium RIFOXYB2_FULL_35_7]OFY93381.1 MAG: hypothetical protein A2491_00715 [Bacteroidetes bacterium RIFOXYC12_FULL_35_7]
MTQNLLIIAFIFGINPFMNFNSITPQANFLAEQKKMARVKTAYKEKEAFIRKLLKEKNVTGTSYDLFIRVFKREKVVEVWVKNKNVKTYSHLIDYDICSSSGELGPKRQMGDNQTPEGVYYIDRFNPTSNFYLSLGVNYPNKSDNILGKKGSLGGDIFIHGDCVTIGCVPLTDDKIKELYILALEAKASGQKNIPVHFFPAKLNAENFNKLKTDFSDNKKFISFWENLLPVYEWFEKYKSIPVVTIDSKGAYKIQNP